MNDETNFARLSASLPQDIKGEAMTRFENLTPELKQMLAGASYQTAMLDIAKSQKLTFEQLAFFQSQTLMALLGFCTADEYRARLAENFAKDDVWMDEFMNLANEKIFDMFKELLHKLF